MEISAKHDDSGALNLLLGSVTFTLPLSVVEQLYQAIHQGLSSGEASSHAALQHKLKAYRALADKMGLVDDRVVQKFAPMVAAEPLVTLARLASSDALYHKILRNLSRQNQRQFAEDFAQMNRISEAHACLYMEQLIPLIKQAAQEQKQLQNSL
ncbi:MAG: hypothetical protein JXR44_01155 [Thiotrichales bacterium]|nr:hypothetical protein [Thiotrichales bacterium]